MFAFRNVTNGGCWLVYPNGDGVLVKAWIGDSRVWFQTARQIVGSDDLTVCDMEPNTASWLDGLKEIEGGAGFTLG